MLINKPVYFFSYLYFARLSSHRLNCLPAERTVRASETTFTTAVNSYRLVFRGFRRRQAVTFFLQRQFNLPFTGRQMMRRPHLSLHFIDYDNFFKCGFAIISHSNMNVTKNNCFDLFLK